MRKSLGFTIIELLISMTIIGLLASLAVASYRSARENSRNAKRRGDMVALQQAFEQYYIANNQNYAATCNTMTTGYLQGSYPAETYVGWAGYNSTCTTSSYCVCAKLEPAGNTKGNASNTSCNFVSGEYFCVQNQQ